MTNKINRAEPPALPLPPEEYNRPFMDQNSNVLRLFFNRVTNTINTLLSTEDGGKFLYLPRGLFYSTTNQTVASVNTGYPVEFENTYIGNIGNGVSIVNNTQITVSAAGMYSFQVTMQAKKSNAATAQVLTWINKNGTDVPYGSQENSIKGNDDIALHWNFSIDLTAGQYIEMYWATNDIDLTLLTTAPATPHPGIPSAVVAVAFVSNL